MAKSKLKNSRCQSESLANQVQYYKTTAGSDSYLTWLHFKAQGCSKSSIYRYLSTYGNKDSVTFKKNPGRPTLIATPQKLAKIKEIFTLNPSTTIAAAAKDLNMTETLLTKVKVHKLGIVSNKRKGRNRAHIKKNNEAYHGGYHNIEELMDVNESSYVLEQEQNCPDLAGKQKSLVLRHCSLCSTSFEEEEGSSCSGLNLEFDLNVGESCLSTELEIIFVLKNLLHLPSILIANLLGKDQNNQNNNPSNWGLVFCPSCRGIVAEAHALFSEIQRLIKDYAEMGERLRNKASLAQSMDSVELICTEQVSIIRQYLMNGSMPSSVPKTVDKLPVDQEEGEEIGQCDVFLDIIKQEPEDESPLDVENVNYYDDDDLLADLSMQVNPLVKEEKESTAKSGRKRTLRPRTRTRKSLAKVEEDDESDENYDDNTDNEDEYYPVQLVSRQKKQKSTHLSPDKPKEKSRQSRRRGPNKKLAKPGKGGISSNWRMGWIPCPHCSSYCINPVIHEAHILRAHKGVGFPYPCELCPRQYSQLHYVLRHIDHKHHSEIKNDPVMDELVAPPPKSESEKQRKQLKQSQLFRALFQIDVVTEKEEDSEEQLDKIFTCRNCSDVKFNSRICAEIHRLRIHTDIHTKLQCSDCGLLFLTLLGLKGHQESAHPSPNPPFNPRAYCSQCELDFVTPNRLSHHVRHIHRRHLFRKREKKIMCKLCSETFFLSSHLLFHQRKCHSEALGLTQFKCHVCSKILCSERNLKVHVASHIARKIEEENKKEELNQNSSGQRGTVIKNNSTCDQFTTTNILPTGLEMTSPEQPNVEYQSVRESVNLNYEIL